MVQKTLGPMESVVQFVLDKGLANDFAPGTGGAFSAASVGDWEKFTNLVMKAGMEEHMERKSAHDDERREMRTQRAAGVLDEGQDDYVDVNSLTDEGIRRMDSALGRTSIGGGPSNWPTCFGILCTTLGTEVSTDARSVAELSDEDVLRLQKSSAGMVAYDYYGMDDPRNHVVAVVKSSKSAKVRYQPLDKTSKEDCVHGVTSPQEFFNHGGWLYEVKFYAETGEDYLRDTAGFGGDLQPGSTRARDAPPPAPESIANGGIAAGGSNLSGGVVRPKRRNIKGRSDFMTSTEALRTYAVSSATMFNNMEEMYLNTISKEYAQEIIEDLFGMWNLPTGDPTTMKYAEDVLWAFLIARTASNKADYKFLIDVPTKSGDVEIDFDVFSRLLANKYGISRRNFARGVADNLRGYLRREENQHLRALSAQRIGADPQMGDMCFDGSTGCTGLTSSEASFARLLEARNLYERDDVIAEGASEKLMQGMSGGVRSIVPR